MVAIKGFDDLKKEAEKEYKANKESYNALFKYILVCGAITTGVVVLSNFRQQRNIEKAVCKALEKTDVTIRAVVVERH